MRVLFVQNNIRAYRVPFFNALVEELGWSVRVVYSEALEMTHPLLFESVQVPSWRFRSLRIQQDLTKHILWADAVVVMFDLRWPSGLVHALWARYLRPVALWGHGFGSSDLAAHLRVWLARRANRVVLYGYQARDRFVQRGVPAHRIVVAPNTVFVKYPKDCSQEPKRHFLYVGRLQARKRLDLLLEAFAAVRMCTSGVYLVLIGDGPERSKLEALARRLGISDRVIFHKGTYDEAELRPWFEGAFAYVTPTRIGLGVLHAFAYGVPVITFRGRDHGPEYEWVRHGRTGLCIDSQSGTDGLARGLAWVLQHPHELENMGKNAFRVYQTKAGPRKMLEGFKHAVEGMLLER